MTAKKLRQKYFDFFIKRGHTIIPSAPLIPENDPSVLFTTAGMHPLVPFLLGERHPAGQRLVNIQQCVRTTDIDQVGDENHLTFFEMLGYWSLGDYFKETSIDYTFGFFTEELKIPKDKISVTVFQGDENVSEDSVSYNYWRDKIGIPEERIFKLGKKDNWWGPVGESGPCGPCTEIFYDTDKAKCHSQCNPSCLCGKYIEIGNNVFMEYNRTKEGKLVLLSQRNVDVGLGLERILAVINNQKSVFETELFWPLISEIENLSGKKYQENLKEFRIIADHLKAATFILAEDLEPSNLERGYILRRLIRRGVRYGRLLGIEEIFTFKIAELVIKIYEEIYPKLKENKDFIEEQLVREEEKFEKTLEKGLKKFNEYKTINGKIAFDLFQTYGFPLELTLELLEEKIGKFDKEKVESEFYEEFRKHQELSRTASVGMFKGGLVDHSKIVTKYHTATHLLYQALRDVLGSDVYQRGSNITAERLRFDFSYSQKMTPEQIQRVEEIVNQKIKASLPVKMEEMSLEEAKKVGAVGLFAEKYGERVKVYSIGDPQQVFSKEICAGPHVQNTSELGHFKIIKEEAVSSGVRRIKAILK